MASEAETSSGWNSFLIVSPRWRGGWRWFNRCHLSRHQRPEDLTCRVVQPAISKPRPPGCPVYVVLAALHQLTSHQPLPPLSTQLPSQKAPHTTNKVSLPLICWLVWHGSSSSLKKKNLKHFVELVLEQGGCGLLSLPPARHTGRASAISSTTWAGAKTRLNDIFVPNLRCLGV